MAGEKIIKKHVNKNILTSKLVGMHGNKCKNLTAKIDSHFSNTS